MSDDAKVVWRELIPKLDAMGVLTKIDGFALIRYVEMYALWKAAMRDLNKHGPRWPQKNADGVVIGYVDRPEVSRVLRLNEALGRLEAKFGLTPSDRASLTVIAKKEISGEGTKKTTKDFLKLGGFA